MTRILIADDHEMMRRGVRSVLKSRPDVDVCEAQNGAEAVEKTKEIKPDLVIFDVSMPVLDGFSAARKIKTVATLTPILIFPLHRTDASVKVAQKIGVSGLSRQEGDRSGSAFLIIVANEGRRFAPRMPTHRGDHRV